MSIALVASVAWVGVALLAPAQKAPSPKLDFNRDILPILSDKCFKCHGPDSGSRQAGLRLDRPDGALAERDGRYVISPGKPDRSLIIQRINNHDAPMPPVDSGKTLTAQQRATLRQWITEGAVFGKHWAFDPLPANVSIPRVVSDWPRDDMDRFILARLKKAQLGPSAPATKVRWLRRVSFDLSGLPPTEQEISDFQLDASPNAFAKVVDRLLASPHYGERMAVEWLDAARYSDSYGYQSDLLSPTWPYRDWVVNAFNKSLPYDQFLTYQLAGDRLPNPTTEQRLATAFNRLHRQSNEGGSIALEYRTEYAVDRTDTFGSAVLGLTIGCARCHDHKFDPISQKEYYQFFAYFNSIDEYGLLLSTEVVPTPSLLLPTVEQQSELGRLHGATNVMAANLAEARLSGAKHFDTWLESRPTAAVIPGIVGQYSLDKNEGGNFANTAKPKSKAYAIGQPKLVPGLKGNAIELDGDNGIAFRDLPGRDRWDPFTWSFWLQDTKQNAAPIILLHRTGGTDVGFCGFDLSLEDGFATARVFRHWPGNAIAVRTKSRIPKGLWTHLAWSWDGSGKAGGLRLYINGQLAPVTVLAETLWKRINAYGDLGPSGGNWSFGQRFRDLGFKGGKIDEVTFADRALDPLEVAQLFDGHSLTDALKAGERSLLSYYLGAVEPTTVAANAGVRKAQMDLANFEEGIREISVMEDAKPEKPAYLLARGRYDAPRTEKTRVQRGVPKIFLPLKGDAPNDRLKLARWVTDPSHPLTSRVAVNRLWQLLFGVGLVETSENFGVQGSRPTHPELLDYLARQFISSGWNVKAMLKRVVLSATYRQDSARTAKLAAADPQNHLFARGPSYRFPAEMIRDGVLAGSGLLNDKPGGPPVNPYQPAGIWTEFNTMTNGFVQSKGSDLYRRSLYSTWKRTTPVPSMMLFDATSREACTIRRPSTNTPLQALVLLNDVQFVEAARVLAERVSALHSETERLTVAFRRLASRNPDGRELAVLKEAYEDQRKQFEADPASANKLLKVGDSKATGAVSATSLAAMTVVVQMIINSDAVVWKR